MFCLCKSVMFVLRRCRPNQSAYSKQKKKRKRRERKEIKTCQIMLCTNRGGDGSEEKLEPPVRANPGGGWGGVEQDGSQGVLCTASTSCLGRDRRQRGLVSGWRERGAEERWSMWWFPLSQHTLPPSRAQVNREREGRRVTGENK